MENKSEPITEYRSDKQPTLEELQEFVGGDIVIASADDKEIVVNSEGLYLNLPINEVASEEYGSRGEPLVGNAMILSGNAKLK